MALKYRLDSLGWYNFEYLVQSLLRAIVGPGVTSFGGSKDGGRDATFVGQANYPSDVDRWSGQWVFQVKFSDVENRGERSAAAAIVKSFPRELRQLMARRRADNYVLVCNPTLSAGDRDALTQSVLAEHPSLKFACIDGREVCQFLDHFPTIRRGNPQLLSYVDLREIVNREVYERSRAFIDNWQPRLDSFVATGAYRKAAEAIQRYHFAVLDGAPEVGKTTIGAALALTYAAAGYEVYDVRSPEDFFRVYDPAEKQFLLADDVIGANAIKSDLLEGWSRDLPGIIKRLNQDHLLCWTARRYLLQEAIEQSRLREALNPFPGVHEITIRADDLSELERAELLYRHAKAARLSGDNRVLVRMAAREIVRDSNFTPERVRQLTEQVLHGDKPSSLEDIREHFRNPGDRWVVAFRSLSLSERTFLIALLDFGSDAPRPELFEAYLERSSGSERPVLTAEECFARLESAFVRLRVSYWGEQTVQFQHPSIRDVLIRELSRDATLRADFLEHASPSAVADLLRGLASRLTGGGDRSYTVSLTTKAEFEKVHSRIVQLAASVLASHEWNQLLIGAEDYLTAALLGADRQSPNLRELLLGIEPTSVSLDGSSLTESVLRVVDDLIGAFCALENYDRHQSYHLVGWLGLLKHWEALAPFASDLQRPRFLTKLTRDVLKGRFKSDDNADVYRYLSWLRETDPVVYRAGGGDAAMGAVVKDAEFEIERLLSMGQRLSSGSPDDTEYGGEYESWLEAVDELEAWAEGLAELYSDELSQPLSRLTDMKEDVVPPEETEPDMDLDEGGDRPTLGPYWTIERMFEDL